jgi:adenosylcobinamide-GDP ribazoletransferase
VAAVVVLGHALVLPPSVLALLAIGAVVLGNRAFHLDGLCDTVDGMAASYDRERSLSVMRSGTAGPAGVVALVLVLGLQAAGLAAVLSSHGYRVAVLAGAAVCVSRAALVVCCTRGVPSARPGGLGDLYTGTVAWPVTALVWLVASAVLSLLGAWVGLAWWRGALAGALALAMVAVVVGRAVHRLGGVTGDVFGAAVEFALATLVVGLS